MVDDDVIYIKEELIGSRADFDCTYPFMYGNEEDDLLWVKKEVTDWSVVVEDDWEPQDCSTERPIYSCFVCHKKFKERTSLLKHNLAHLKVSLQKPELHKCEECDVYFETGAGFRKHASHHTRGTPSDTKKYHCAKCDRYYSYKVWTSHMIDVHGGDRCSCDVCGAQLKCKRYLRNHMRNVHNRLSQSTCQICKKAFSDGPKLKCHMRNVHYVDGDRCACDVCGAQFKCPNYLSTHKYRVHYDDGRAHECGVCGKTFKAPRRVAIHVKHAHSEERRKEGRANRGGRPAQTSGSRS